MASNLRTLQRPLDQIAALPVRLHDEGWVEVLLVTSPETGRWIVPKDWPRQGVDPHLDAARAAFDEAGLHGSADPEPFGEFTYDKRMASGLVLPCRVAVHLMRVEGQVDRWSGCGRCNCQWMSAREASRRVCNPVLQRLIARAGRSADLIRRTSGIAVSARRARQRSSYLAS